MLSTLAFQPPLASAAAGAVLFLIVLAGVAWILPIFVSANITQGKGRGSAAGILLGVFLGWIGVLIAALLSRDPSVPAPVRPVVAPTSSRPTAQIEKALYRECPECKESMRRDARICPHCRSESEPWILHAGFWWHVKPGSVHRFLERQQRWQKMNPPPSSEGENATADAAARAQTRTCPSCQTLISRLATRCPNCQEPVQPFTLWQGVWWFKLPSSGWRWLADDNTSWCTLPVAWEAQQDGKETEVAPATAEVTAVPDA